MKKALLIFSSLLLTLHVYCQDYKISLEKQFLAYTDLIIQKEYLKSTDYINEDFLKIISKLQMAAILEKTLNNPDIDYRIEGSKVFQIEDLRDFNNTKYVKFKYSNVIVMKFNIVAIPNDTTSSETYAKKQSLITKALETQFGSDNVKYNDTTKYYQIYSLKKAIANSKDTQNWKFVTVEERQKALLEKFIPKELLED